MLIHFIAAQKWLIHCINVKMCFWWWCAKLIFQWSKTWNKCINCVKFTSNNYLSRILLDYNYIKKQTNRSAQNKNVITKIN